MRFAHHGIVKNLTIYTLGDRPVRYNSNRTCNVVNTKAPFKNSIGTVTTKSVPISKEWHLNHVTNIDNVLAAIKSALIKGAGLGAVDHTTQSSSDQCVQTNVDGSCKAASIDEQTNTLENILMQLYSILSKAPPDLY